VTPERLREKLVAHLRARGDVRTERVAAAFARVPRHAFLPELPPEDAYADRSIAIKLQDGVAISSSSQPAIMAEMLEMLAVREGDRVLEIGAGSGYNAALLAEIVGPAGYVETIDLDDDLVAAARTHLESAGYARVHVVLGDGARGDPANAPFDAVIASVGVEGIPPAWIAQLRAGGRLVAPLTIRSLQKVVAFERTANGLESRAIVDAAFIMLRGPSASSDTVTLAVGDAGIALRVFAEHAPSVDPNALGAALRAPPSDAWPARRMHLDDLWTGVSLWLALRDDGFCRLTAQGASARFVPNVSPGADAYAGTLGLCGPHLTVFAPRAAFGVTLRRFGPDAGTLSRMQAELIAWDAAGRPGNAALRVTVDASGTAHAALRPRA
jgi:protein-L-isoaspartate(D-aspartate) O-methyltransferase